MRGIVLENNFEAVVGVVVTCVRTTIESIAPNGGITELSPSNWTLPEITGP